MRYKVERINIPNCEYGAFPFGTPCKKDAHRTIQIAGNPNFKHLYKTCIFHTGKIITLLMDDTKKVIV